MPSENLIDWISELDKYFEYEEIEEEKKVKFDVTRLNKPMKKQEQTYD